VTTGQLLDLAERVGPVMIFLVSITVVAEIADIAGVFDVAGHWAARLGRHRTPLLWLLLVLLSCLATIVLSLDTTAVLLTPVVIAVARQLGLSAVPFVMTTVWLANTASLLLPVSNLTNLLALHHFSLLGLGSAGYLRLALWPAVASIAASVAVLAVLHRRSLSGRYELDAPPEPHDRVLLVVAGAVCVALGPAFVSGVTPAIPATIAAVVLAVVLGARSMRTLRRVKVPWLVVLGVCALFVVVDAAGRRGLNALLTAWVGDGSTGADLLRLSGIGAVSANVVNNLPAYLALEPVASADPQRLMALLIGVNCGPLVTIWASLATILWRERCRKGDVSVSVVTFAWQGGLCAAASIGAAVAALTWLHP
jgi:arsenical pump membrane protein